MKPRIDLTAQGSHAIWESGRWDAEKAVGRSTVIAGPEGEKLNVVYDSDPNKTNFHYLFFANPGQIIANAFVREIKDPTAIIGSFKKYKYDLELLRIEALTNDIIQGESVPKAQYAPLWTLKKFGTYPCKDMVDASYNSSRLGYRPVYRDLILAAVEKAFTSAQHQELFWGIPRPEQARA